MSDKSDLPQVGLVYRHYKSGHLYLVLAVGEHTDTAEKVVVYRLLVGDPKVWVRPLSQWFEKAWIERDNVKITVTRFTRVVA